MAVHPVVLTGTTLDSTRRGYTRLDAGVLDSARKVLVQALQDYDVDGE